MDADGIHELAAAHALDALDPDERRAFEEHLASCERCRAEVAELQEAAAALAYGVDAAEPPPRLRERLLERARAEREGVVVPLRRRRIERALAYAALPAAAAAAGFGIWAGVLHDRLDRERQDAAAVAAILSDPRAARVQLRGGAGELVVGRDRRGVLVVRRLPPPPSSKTYEAWVIADGRTEPAGLFREREVVALSRPVPRNAVVAITVEPRGGSKRPTQQPVTSARA
jgi:anti-sigma-K factor RskA